MKVVYERKKKKRKKKKRNTIYKRNYLAGNHSRPDSIVGLFSNNLEVSRDSLEATACGPVANVLTHVESL